MSRPTHVTGDVAFDATTIGRTFWSRKSVALLIGGVIGLWAVPVGLIYGLTSSF